MNSEGPNDTSDTRFVLKMASVPFEVTIVLIPTLELISKGMSFAFYRGLCQSLEVRNSSITKWLRLDPWSSAPRAVISWMDPQATRKRCWCAMSAVQKIKV